MGEPSGDKSKGIPRRTFLKGLAALAGALVVGPKAIDYIDSKLIAGHEVDWMEHDFVGDPKILSENPFLREKMTQELDSWGGLCSEMWKIEQKKNGDVETGYIDLDKWGENSQKLVNEVYKLGSLLEQSKNQGFDRSRIELEIKYAEYATYLQYTLIAGDFFRNQGVEKAYELTNTLSEQNIPMLAVGSDSIDSVMPNDKKRLQILSAWNYPWESMTKNESSGTHPILSQIVSADGSELWNRPSWFAARLLQENDRNIEEDPTTLWQKPKEVKIINFDPEVTQVMRDKMRKIGIERGLTSLSWMEIDSFEQGNTNPKTGEISIGGGNMKLDLETYEKYAGVYDKIAFHEGLHGLVQRSTMLREIDRLEFRDYMLKIAKRHDPFRSIKTIFCPDDEYPKIPEEIYKNSLEIKKKFSEAPNEMIATEYAMDVSLGAVYGQSVKPYLDELRAGISIMGGKDIYHDLWPESQSMGSYIDGLNSKIESLTGVSKLVAETMIANKELIENIKRQSLLQNINSPAFIPEIVLPLVVTHLALYQSDKLQKAASEGVNKEVGVSFYNSWKTRLNAQLSDRVYEDLVADVVGFMLVDPGDKKANWGDTFDDFVHMLAVLKRNGLAYNKANETV